MREATDSGCELQQQRGFNAVAAVEVYVRRTLAF